MEIANDGTLDPRRLDKSVKMRYTTQRLVSVWNVPHSYGYCARRLLVAIFERFYFLNFHAVLIGTPFCLL